MAATTVIHDELTGLTLLLKDEDTTVSMTVTSNGRKIDLPAATHRRLYEAAETLLCRMRTLPSERGALATEISPAST